LIAIAAARPAAATSNFAETGWRVQLDFKRGARVSRLPFNSPRPAVGATPFAAQASNEPHATSLRFHTKQASIPVS
jgi:hypothetical protein